MLRWSDAGDSMARVKTGLGEVKKCWVKLAEVSTQFSCSPTTCSLSLHLALDLELILFHDDLSATFEAQNGGLNF